MRCMGPWSDERRATRVGRVVVQRKVVARASLATPLLGSSLRRQTDVILKTTGANHHNPRLQPGCRRPRGIRHNIQLQVVRQCDPKKILQQKRKA